MGSDKIAITSSYTIDNSIEYRSIRIYKILVLQSIVFGSIERCQDSFIPYNQEVKRKDWHIHYAINMLFLRKAKLIVCCR